MKLLKQKLKTTYEYVLDLKERLSDTCELAQKELHKVQTKQAKYFNRNTEDRIFQAEDGIRDLVRSRGLGDVYKRQPFELLYGRTVNK